MWKDPIVEEIRKIRVKFETEFGTDSKAFLESIYKQQNKNKKRLVVRALQKTYPHALKKVA